MANLVEALESVRLALRDGRAAEAEEASRRLVAAQPDSPDAVALLGTIRVQRGDLDEGIRHLRTACQLAPEQSGFHNNLALALSRAGEVQDAIASYREALARRPDEVFVLLNLGRLLRKVGRLNEAAEAFRRALGLQPDSPELLCFLADTLVLRGRPGEAEPLYRRALALRPGWAMAHYALALAKTFATEHDPDLLALHALADSETTTAEDRIYLSFALGRAYDDLDRPDRAFAYFAAGNDAKRSGLPVARLADEIALIDRVIEVFDERLIEEKTSWGLGTSQPIFLVGMPRSGKTLLEERLASYSGVYAGGECGVIEVSADGGDLPYPDGVRTLRRPEIERAARGLLEQMRRIAPMAAQFTNTMPGNFMKVGLIHLLFPQAPIVHCVRDPRDVALRIYFKLFQQGWEFSCDLEALGRYLAAYERLMRHWDRLLGEAVLTVRYEDLVTATRATTHRVARFCGLSENDRIARPPELDVAEVGRWRRYEPQLEPLLRSFAQSRAAAARVRPALASAAR